jgi:hypothetical protein
METVPIVQRHKLASLQDIHVAQTRKWSLVNRPFSYRRAEDHRIKATLGITGLSPPIVHIDGEVWHLNISGRHGSDSKSRVCFSVEKELKQIK